MNKRQAKGIGNEVAGKIQQQAGKVVGSKKQQAKGLKKQIVGTAQRAVGDVEEAVKDSRKARAKAQVRTTGIRRASRLD